MIWILGIGLFLFLLFVFPRQMGALLLLLGLFGLGLIAWIYRADHQRAEDHRRMVAAIHLTASYDLARCSAEFPILIRFANGYSETIQSLNFDLSGYRTGFSSPVYREPRLESDRIIRPGESYEACWPVPPRYDVARAYPPPALDWRASFLDARFGNGP